MLARKPRKSSLQQDDRLPVSTLEQAVNRLVSYRQNPDITQDAYDLVIKFAADLFWLTEYRSGNAVAALP